MSNQILHSSDYNLRFVCPNILMYKDRYTDYLTDVSTFKLEEDFLLEYFKIQDPFLKISAFSSYLTFNIIFNFLQNKVVIKKDIENYYNSQMLNFLKKIGYLSQFQLKSLALTWGSINKTIDLFLSQIKNYDGVKIDYKLHWSDTSFNYEERVPLIGINDKEDSIDVFLILQTSFEKYPLYSNDIDYLRIPSNVRILNYFLDQNIDIRFLKILWIDNSNINQKFKFSEYAGISKDRVKSYVKDNSEVSNFFNNSLNKYNNLKQCYSCPYFVSCSSSKLLLNSERIPYKPQNKNNNYETII